MGPLGVHLLATYQQHIIIYYYQNRIKTASKQKCYLVDNFICNSDTVINLLFEYRAKGLNVFQVEQSCGESSWREPVRPILGRHKLGESISRQEHHGKIRILKEGQQKEDG